MRRLKGLLLLLFAGSAFADDVFFQAGGSLRGLVVEEHDDRVVVSTEQGEKTVPRKEIDEIFFSESERNQLYLGERALEQGDFGGARHFFQKALQLNPLLLEAKDALGRLEETELKAGQPPVRDPLAALAALGLTLRAAQGARDDSRAVSGPSTGIGHSGTRQAEGWVVVEGVARGSEAQRWGLAVGDALAAHWGASLRYLPPAEAARRILGPPGSALKLTVQRGVDLPPAGAQPQAGWPGFTLEMEHFGLTAGEVAPTAPAFLVGLRSGDRIVRLGGAPTRYMPLGAARKAVQQARGKGIPLVIHRDLMITREGKTNE